MAGALINCVVVVGSVLGSRRRLRSNNSDEVTTKCGLSQAFRPKTTHVVFGLQQVEGCECDSPERLHAQGSCNGFLPFRCCAPMQQRQQANHPNGFRKHQNDIRFGALRKTRTPTAQVSKAKWGSRLPWWDSDQEGECILPAARISLIPGDP